MRTDWSTQTGALRKVVYDIFVPKIAKDHPGLKLLIELKE